MLAPAPVAVAQSEAGPPIFRVAGPPALTSVLIPATLESFARENGLTLRREIHSDDAFALALIGGSDGGIVARFEFRQADTASALDALGAGAIDLAVTTWTPSDVDLAGADDATTAQVIARDALVAIVAQDNPARRISPELLAKVVSGEVTDWSDIGGRPGPIALHLPARDSELAASISGRLLGGGDIGAVAQTHSSAIDLADAVASSSGGLGVTRVSETGNARALALTGSCGIVIAPDRMNIKNDDFPLTMPIFISGSTDAMPDILGDYLGHLNTTAAQGPIRQGGFVNLLNETQPLEAQGGRLVAAISLAGVRAPVSELRRLVEVLSGQARLSITFRFVPGTSKIDASAQANVQRLAEAPRAGEFDGSVLTFVGFSDGVGASARNLEVGRSRARTVEKAVRDAAGDLDSTNVKLGNNSFGETLPVACDDSDWGRHLNRRVEVWID